MRPSLVTGFRIEASSRVSSTGTPSAETTKGGWYGTILDDMKYGHTRYQIRGKHEQTLRRHEHQGRYRSRLRFRLSEGSRVERQPRGARIPLGRWRSSRSLGRSLLTAEAAYFDDLSQKSNDATLHYAPSASYFTEYLSVLKQRAYVDLSSDATNFMNDKGDRFTRFTATPALRVPYSVSGLNFLFSGAVTEKTYLTDQRTATTNENSVHHELLTVQGDANMQFRKNTYTGLFDLGQVQSIISPRVQYSYLKNTGSFANVPTIDPSDRTNDANILTYSFNHYFNAVTDGQVREISLIEIQQTYGLSRSLEAQPLLYYGAGDRLSDIHFRFTLFPHANFYFTSDDVLSIHGQGFTTMTNTLHYAIPPLFQIDLSHTYTKQFLRPETEEQGRTLSSEMWVNTITRWKAFDLNYQIRYSFLDSTWIDTLAALTYHPSCWGVTLAVSKTRRPNDTSIHLSFNLQGITQNIGGF